MLMLHSAGLPYLWDDDVANTWPGPKQNMPFGQLPVLVHNGHVIAQSGAITRYCASLAGMWPKEILSLARADMLIEHCNDMFELMGGAKYAGDEEAQLVAWAVLADKKYPEWLGWLAKMLGDHKFFGGEAADAGDIAVFSVVNLAVRAGLDFPEEAFPALVAHSRRVSRLGAIPDYLAACPPAYFKRPTSPEVSVATV